MKLIYAQGFSKNEKLEWKPVVFNNIIQSFRLIFEAMNELDIHFSNPENEASRPHPFQVLLGIPGFRFAIRWLRPCRRWIGRR
jgi:hypothetical protein